ncbi:aminopeptidase [Microbulbifer yueqingensis]|uniref:Predicted aminopeptidase n=1 Tax=Microbulbifer yueqingensis TaxID=658219 RepID=A0A1G9BD00_9GAMM|nr:aminopeptidase [Microbulbifer yueqingensis]SDK37418.1 Predicted aminopeptidase [Microbulbifer yueqingensis]
MYISLRHNLRRLYHRLSRAALCGVAGVALLAAALLSGCETASYYTQAATGQLRILAARQPLERVIDADDTDVALQERLRLVQAIRGYASGELKLPVGDAYGAYVKLASDYPLWNVLAAPEFSLEPKRWCYPVAGCASYRGYFDREDAVAKGRQLTEEGFDVYLGPVPAYSTLGWFDDPVLSSFVNWPEDRLAGLLFHELAHRRVYIANDTKFNESFATAVSRLALPDWRRRQGMTGPAPDRTAQAQAVRQLMASARKRLEVIYDSGMEEHIMRARKQEVLARLRACYRKMSAGWPNPTRYQAYIDKTNNATLALASEYESRVPAFEELYRRSGSWEAFYEATERLGKLEKEERNLELNALAAGNQLSSRKVTGPSFDSETCMSAANMPLATAGSRSRARSTK